MYKVITCHPSFFPELLQKWIDEQDKKLPNYITTFKIVKITNFDINNEVSHYIKWNLQKYD